MIDRYVMRYNGFDIMKDGNDEFYITLQKIGGAIRINEDETYDSIPATQRRILELIDEMKLRFIDDMTEGDKRRMLLEHTGLKELKDIE